MSPVIEYVGSPNGGRVQHYDVQDFLISLKESIVQGGEDDDEVPNSRVNIEIVDKVIMIRIWHCFDYISDINSIVLANELPHDLPPNILINMVKTLVASIS